jgi:hypothetical protein
VAAWAQRVSNSTTCGEATSTGKQVLRSAGAATLKRLAASGAAVEPFDEGVGVAEQAAERKCQAQPQLIVANEQNPRNRRPFQPATSTD